MSRAMPVGCIVPPGTDFADAFCRSGRQALALAAEPAKAPESGAGGDSRGNLATTPAKTRSLLLAALRAGKLKAMMAAALLAALFWALPAEAQDGTKFLALRWDLVETVTLTDAGGGVEIRASGQWREGMSASLTDPDGRVHALDLQNLDGRFVLGASAPGGPWSPDGLHALVFEGGGARDEVPVELSGGALAPGFGAASRSGETVTFRTWDMITRASVESRGGADTVEIEAQTGRTSPVTANLLLPDGSLSVLDVIAPDGRYSFLAAVGGPLWSQDGDYTLLLEQPGSPPYRDDLILPVSGGAVALPVEPYPRDEITYSERWSEVERVSVSAESLSVAGSSERELRVSLLSPGGVSVPLGAVGPGEFSARYGMNAPEPGAYVVQFGEPGDELIAYLGIKGAGEYFEAERWAMLERAAVVSGEPDAVELSGSTDRAAPVSVLLAGPDGQVERLPPVLPKGGKFSISAPVPVWKDGMYAVSVEQPGSPPYLDVYAVSAESGRPVSTVHVGDVKASGARWSAVEKVSVRGSTVSISGSSENDLTARASLPDGSLADVGQIRSEGGAVSLELDASEEPWNGSGAYALILEGPGVRDVVPLLMEGGRAAPGFGQGDEASLKAWDLIRSASVQRQGGSDVLLVRGTASGPVAVALLPPGGEPAELATAEPDGGEFSVEITVGGSAWSRDGVYAVAFEQGEPPLRDHLYLEVSGGSVVPEFGAAFAALAAASGAALVARLAPRIQIRA